MRRVREPDPTGIGYRCSWPRGRQRKLGKYRSAKVL